MKTQEKEKKRKILQYLNFLQLVHLIFGLKKKGPLKIFFFKRKRKKKEMIEKKRKRKK